MYQFEPLKENMATSDLEKACPQRLITGLVGAGLVSAGSVALSLAHSALSSQAGLVILLLLTFLTMASIEVIVFRVHRFQFDFSKRRPLSRVQQTDFLRRFGALLITLAIAWATYWALGEYGLRFTGLLRPRFEESWYKPFFLFFKVLTVGLPIMALPYFYLCAAYGKWPREEDEFLKLWAGYGCLFRLNNPGPEYFAAIRSLCVKFFFVPVMTVFLVNNAHSFEANLLHLLAGPMVLDVAFAGRLYRVLYEGLFLLDVNLALLGYVCCFRILDTHIRSAEPTLFGWAVALACYPPFNARLTGLYLPHDPNSQTWESLLAGWPWLYCLVGVAILFLVWVYLYGTIAFGFRFSNLTHRGIICRGPYRWIRHPAYAAKNLSWWLISLPFLSNPAACARLLLLNVLYVFRALTEERHLSRDPVYREYMERVKWRFIPGVI
jgi:protein-S-isoprenylcysteine O-methyltransferase Ste14